MGGRNVDNICLIGSVIELFMYFRYQPDETFYCSFFSFFLYAERDIYIYIYIYNIYKL